MNTLFDFATLLLLTIAAGGLALALDWLLLRAAFHLMRPAGEPRLADARSLAAPR
jgi:hypothetical protein